MSSTTHGHDNVRHRCINSCSRGYNSKDENFITIFTDDKTGQAGRWFPTGVWQLTKDLQAKTNCTCVITYVTTWFPSFTAARTAISFINQRKTSMLQPVDIAEGVESSIEAMNHCVPRMLADPTRQLETLPTSARVAGGKPHHSQGPQHTSC